MDKPEGIYDSKSKGSHEIYVKRSTANINKAKQYIKKKINRRSEKLAQPSPDLLSGGIRVRTVSKTDNICETNEDNAVLMSIKNQAPNSRASTSKSTGSSCNYEVIGQPKPKSSENLNIPIPPLRSTSQHVHSVAQTQHTNSTMVPMSTSDLDGRPSTIVDGGIAESETNFIEVSSKLNLQEALRRNREAQAAPNSSGMVYESADKTTCGETHFPPLDRVSLPHTNLRAPDTPVHCRMRPGGGFLKKMNCRPTIAMNHCMPNPPKRGVNVSAGQSRPPWCNNKEVRSGGKVRPKSISIGTYLGVDNFDNDPSMKRMRSLEYLKDLDDIDIKTVERKANDFFSKADTLHTNDTYCMSPKSRVQKKIANLRALADLKESQLDLARSEASTTAGTIRNPVYENAECGQIVGPVSKGIQASGLRSVNSLDTGTILSTSRSCGELVQENIETLETKPVQIERSRSTGSDNASTIQIETLFNGQPIGDPNAYFPKTISNDYGLSLSNLKNIGKRASKKAISGIKVLSKSKPDLSTSPKEITEFAIVPPQLPNKDYSPKCSETQRESPTTPDSEMTPVPRPRFKLPIRGRIRSASIQPAPLTPSPMPTPRSKGTLGCRLDSVSQVGISTIDRANDLVLSPGDHQHSRHGHTKFDFQYPIYRSKSENNMIDAISNHEDSYEVLPRFSRNLSADIMKSIESLDNKFDTLNSDKKIIDILKVETQSNRLDSEAIYTTTGISNCSAQCSVSAAGAKNDSAASASSSKIGSGSASNLRQNALVNESSNAISGLDNLLRISSRDSCLTSLNETDISQTNNNNLLTSVSIQDIQNHLELTRQLASTLENVLAMKMNDSNSESK